MRRGSEKRNFLRALKAYWFERRNFLLLRERMAFYFLIFRSTNISIMRVKGVKCQGYETSIIFTLNLLEISLKKSFKGKKIIWTCCLLPFEIIKLKNYEQMMMVMMMGVKLWKMKCVYWADDDESTLMAWLMAQNNFLPFIKCFKKSVLCDFFFCEGKMCVKIYEL